MPAGRPSDFKEEYIKQAYKLALLGATDVEMSDFFNTSEVTFNKWKKDYPEFLKSLKRGKLDADARVTKRLFERAMGYEHDDLYITQYQGKIVQETIRKYFPPDTTACIFWLKNRQPDKWREKQEIDHTTKGDKIVINFKDAGN